MAKFRIVNTKFWSDNFVSNLDPLEKLLFLYFITNPFTNICGIYEISLKQIALDTGIDRENIEKVLLPRLERAGKVYYIEGWVYVKNFMRHQKAVGNIQAAISNALREVPEKILQEIKNIDSSIKTIIKEKRLVLSQRQIVLVRDKFKCAYCKKEITSDGDYEMDHVIPLSGGGQSKYTNYVASCKNCNQIKGDRSAAEYGFPEVRGTYCHANRTLRELRENIFLRKLFEGCFNVVLEVKGIDIFIKNDTECYRLLPTVTDQQSESEFKSEFKFKSESLYKDKSLYKEGSNSHLKNIVSKNIDEKVSKKPTGKANGETQIPDWLDAGVWESFRTMRKKMKKPLTEEAERLAIQKLDRFKKEGQDPVAVLNQSILNSWTGLFAVKEERKEKFI